MLYGFEFFSWISFFVELFLGISYPLSLSSTKYNRKLNKFPSLLLLLLRLNQSLYYALCLSYHSNIEAALFACLSSGWATKT